jgi:hypothetical protein
MKEPTADWFDGYLAGMECGEQAGVRAGIAATLEEMRGEMRSFVRHTRARMREEYERSRSDLADLATHLDGRAAPWRPSLRVRTLTEEEMRNR